MLNVPAGFFVENAISANIYIFALHRKYIAKFKKTRTFLKLQYCSTREKTIEPCGLESGQNCDLKALAGVMWKVA